MQEAPDHSLAGAEPFNRRTVYVVVLLTAFTLSVAWNGVLTTLIPLYGGNVLRLGSSRIAAVLSAAYLLDVTLLFPAGRIMDRGSRTILLAPALIVLVAAVMLLPHAGSFLTYLGTSMFFMTGLVIWHVPEILVADLRPRSRQLLMLAAVRFVSDLAFLLAPVMVGYLVQHAGYGAAAWAVALLILGNLFMAAFEAVRRKVGSSLSAARAGIGGMSTPSPKSPEG